MTAISFLCRHSKTGWGIAYLIAGGISLVVDIFVFLNAGALAFFPFWLLLTAVTIVPASVLRSYRNAPLRRGWASLYLFLLFGLVIFVKAMIGSGNPGAGSLLLVASLILSWRILRDHESAALGMNEIPSDVEIGAPSAWDFGTIVEAKSEESHEDQPLTPEFKQEKHQMDKIQLLKGLSLAHWAIFATLVGGWMYLHEEWPWYGDMPKWLFWPGGILILGFCLKLSTKSFNTWTSKFLTFAKHAWMPITLICGLIATVWAASAGLAHVKAKIPHFQLEAEPRMDPDLLLDVLLSDHRLAEVVLDEEGKRLWKNYVQSCMYQGLSQEEASKRFVVEFYIRSWVRINERDVFEKFAELKGLPRVKPGYWYDELAREARARTHVTDDRWDNRPSM